MHPAIKALRSMRAKSRRGRVARDGEDKGYEVEVAVSPTDNGPHPEPVDTGMDEEDEELGGY